MERTSEHYKDGSYVYTCLILQLPFKILGHFYSGQCEYTEAVLINIASCIESKSINQPTEGVSALPHILYILAALFETLADNI